MGLNLPSYNRKNTPAPSFLPVGEYDASLYQSKYKKTRRGGDMMITQFIVDNGPSQGGKVDGSFFFGHETGFGEKMLQDFANHARRADGSLDPAVDPATGHLLLVDAQGQPTLDPAVAQKDPAGDPIPLKPGGFVYSADFPSFEGFCRQFELDPPLRVHLRVYHEYDIEPNGGGDWERRVSKEKFDNHTAAGGRGAVKAQYRITGPPKAAPTLPVKPKVAPPASAQGDGQAAYPQQAAQVGPPAVAAPATGTAFPFGQN